VNISIFFSRDDCLSEMEVLMKAAALHRWMHPAPSDLRCVSTSLGAGHRRQTPHRVNYAYDRGKTNDDLPHARKRTDRLSRSDWKMWRVSCSQRAAWRS